MIQRKNSGFTIIEIIIVITIMAILTSVVVISLRTSQENANDKERKDDVEAIARTLENIYTNGIQSSSDASLKQPMGYPGTVWVSNMISNPSHPQIVAILEDLELSSLKTPGSSVSNPPYDIVSAASNSVPLPSSSVPADKYVYQPLRSDGSMCSYANGGLHPIQPRAESPCVKFNIYYKKSNGDVVTTESINQ